MFCSRTSLLVRPQEGYHGHQYQNLEEAVSKAGRDTVLATPEAGSRGTTNSELKALKQSLKPAARRWAQEDCNSTLGLDIYSMMHSDMQ